MKVKLLRRAFCVVMCVVILACSSVNAFAAELFNDEYEYKWGNSSGSSVYIDWFNVNFPTSGRITYSDLFSGVWSWISVINSINANNTYTNTTSTGWISFSIVTSEAWWNARTGLWADYTYAFTHPYDENNIVIRDGMVVDPDYPATHPMCGQRIMYANVFFNYDTTIFTGVTKSSIVAHEIGHVLGFGHETSNSIMEQGTLSYTQIQGTDITNYNDKYN